MDRLISGIRELHLLPRLFGGWVVLVLLFLVGTFFPRVFGLAQVLSLVFFGFLLLDLALIYSRRHGITGYRSLADKLSLGDENLITLTLASRYHMDLRATVTDEIPAVFQKRDFRQHIQLPRRATREITYTLVPKRRGVYRFGAINVLVSSSIGFAARRYKLPQDQSADVYPSIIQLKKYEFLAIHNQLTEYGLKKIRRVGHTMEFDQIRTYTPGDDIRSLNWKATARAHQLMVNQYQDERSQAIYSMVDMGRAMRMPFYGMTLLDYAINTSLVMSNTALRKQDKAGLLTFSHELHDFLPAQRKTHTLERILKTLYAQDTLFLEPDYARWYSFVRQRITQRSLLLLYTNVESLISMRRLLPYWRQAAKQHLVVVIFFLNEELVQLAERPAENLEQVYLQATAEKFAAEKRQIVRELKANGIYSILTYPQNLTVNTINTYLQFKARGLI